MATENEKNLWVIRSVTFHVFPYRFSVLMKCFNGFCKEGVVHAETVNEILQMMGLRVKQEALDAIIQEVDEDGKTIFFIFV